MGCDSLFTSDGINTSSIAVSCSWLKTPSRFRLRLNSLTTIWARSSFTSTTAGPISSDRSCSTNCATSASIIDSASRASCSRSRIFVLTIDSRSSTSNRKTFSRAASPGSMLRGTEMSTKNTGPFLRDLSARFVSAGRIT